MSYSSSLSTPSLVGLKPHWDYFPLLPAPTSYLLEPRLDVFQVLCHKTDGLKHWSSYRWKVATPDERVTFPACLTKCTLRKNKMRDCVCNISQSVYLHLTVSSCFPSWRLRTQQGESRTWNCCKGPLSPKTCHTFSESGIKHYSPFLDYCLGCNAVITIKMWAHLKLLSNPH